MDECYGSGAGGRSLFPPLSFGLYIGLREFSFDGDSFFFVSEIRW